MLATHMVGFSLLQKTHAGTNSKFTWEFSDAIRLRKKRCLSKKGDSSILDKGKNACSGIPDANTLTFEAGGLLNFDVKEVILANRMTQSFSSLKEHVQRHQNIHSTRLEAPSQSG